MSTELDKFKRRVIRSVARVLRHGGPEGLADKHIWHDLQREVGCDCKLLWERMRTLTLKKMKRLLPAEDRLRAIADVAQMQLTDWLLFDLVLVHEDIDVISEDPNCKSMKDLIHLVQMFEIEGKCGDDLTTAWTAATFYYNSFGRQCSPMLLQRRWYQLKKTTRSKFYTFWFEYRGNPRLLVAAKKSMPNTLHSIVAQRYPYIVTKPFKEWHELIEDKLVILPEEFEMKMRAKTTTAKSEKNEPDLVLVEPHIETIDLGIDTDSENDAGGSKKNKSDEGTFKPAINIKKEIEDEVEVDLEDLDETDAIDIEDNEVGGPEELIEKSEETGADEINDKPSDDNESVAYNKTNNEELNQVVSELIDDINAESGDVACTEIATDIVKVEHGVLEVIDDVEEIDDDIVKINDSVEEVNADVVTPETGQEEIVMPQIMNVFGNVNVPVEKLSALPLVRTSSSISETIAPEMDGDESIEEVIRRKAVEFTIDVGRKILTNDVVMVEDSVDVDVNETPPENESTGVVVKNELSPDVKIDGMQATVDNVISPYGAISAGLTFVDDGIEFVDDGIEFDEHDEDDGSDFKPEDYPPENSDKETSEDASKIDMKLLMQSLVYLIRLDDIAAFKNQNFESVKDKTLIDTALEESKPIFPIVKKEKDIAEEPLQADEPQILESSDSEEDGVSDTIKVKLSSHLLQKPRSRSYHPIQLCKNPDFNTRLKRLTFGFLSSTRNRLMLKTLKPMTIDVSKAFEGKLLNGTMYLKNDGDPTVKSEPVFEEPSEQATAVLPSGLPVQSLIDNIDDRDVLQKIAPKPIDSVVTERQKTINLPDINNIRRINQQLLTAEVTPMRSSVTIDKFNPPVRLVAPQNKGTEKVDSDNEVQISTIPNVTVMNPVKTKPPEIRDIVYQDIIEKNKVIDEVAPPTEKQTSQEIAGTSSATLEKASLNKPQKPKDKQPYRVRRKVQPLPWNQPVPGTKIMQDSLLTLDTLQKMLNIVCANDNGVEVVKMKPKQLKRSLKKKRWELDKKIERYEEKIKQLNQQDNINESKESESSATDEVGECPAKRQKVNATDKNPYGSHCCWARIKLISYEIAKTKKHLCPRICTCCCRAELAAKTKWMNKMKRKSNEIVISDEDDDDDGQSITDTIEDVIKQSSQKESLPVPRTNLKKYAPKVSNKVPVKMRTEVSIQCDLGPLPEEAKTNEISPNKPIVRIVKQKAGQPSNDVITLDDADDASSGNAVVTPGAYVPIAPKVRGHIIIDGTKNLTVRNTYSNYKSRTKNTTNVKPTSNKLKEKVIYINDYKKLGKEPTAPIYLGTNKILLTDVKFPTKICRKPPVEVPKITEQQQMTAPVILPPGVQLVLLPNGIVTYSVDPTVELTEEHKATLPTIVAAVQQHLNQSGTLNTANGNPPLAASNPTKMNSNDNNIMDADNVTQENSETSSHVITERNDLDAAINTVSGENTGTENIQANSDIEKEILNIPQQNSIENTACAIEGEISTNNSVSESVAEGLSEQTNTVINKNKNVSIDGTTTEKSLMSDEIFSEHEQSQEKTDNDDSEKGPTTAINSNEEQNIALDKVEESTVANQEETPGLAANNNRKSLLSDLMQMSGIWDDIQDDEPTPNANTDESLQVPSKEIVGDLPTEVLPQEVIPASDVPATLPVVDLTSNHIPVPGLVPLKPVTPTVDPSIPELTPIMSFDQLRYACENNGNFFKLDLEQGTISCGIKVCIKRQMPQSVIDLTEDDYVAEAQITQGRVPDSSVKRPMAYSLPENLSRSLLKVKNPDTTIELVKPIKLFRSVRILRRNKEETVFLPAVPNKGTKRQRKQNLEEVRDEEGNSIEAVHDEDSIDSASLDKYIYRDSDFLDSSLESSDYNSSDDEPLAAKVKRIRVYEPSEDNAMDGQTVRSAASTTEMEQDQFDENLENQKRSSTIGSIPQDDNDDLSNNMLQQLPKNLLAFMPDNIDDQNDDCILGV